VWGSVRGLLGDSSKGDTGDEYRGVGVGGGELAVVSWGKRGRGRRRKNSL